MPEQQTEYYGACTSIRVWYEDGREVEFGIVEPPWISMPLDNGTYRVLSDGYKIIIHKELAEKINSVEIFFKEGISKSGFRVLTDIVWKFEYRFMDWAKIKYVYENKLQNK